MLALSSWFENHLAHCYEELDLQIDKPVVMGIGQTFQSAIRSGIADLYGGVQVVFVYSVYSNIAGNVEGEERQEILHTISQWASSHFLEPQFANELNKEITVEEYEEIIPRIDRQWRR